MSHPSSSSFRALQAHFANRAPLTQTATTPPDLDGAHPSQDDEPTTGEGPYPGHIHYTTGSHEQEPQPQAGMDGEQPHNLEFHAPFGYSNSHPSDDNMTDKLDPRILGIVPLNEGPIDASFDGSAMQTDSLLEMQNGLHEEASTIDRTAEGTLRLLEATDDDVGEYFRRPKAEARKTSSRAVRGRVVKRRGPRKAAEPTGDVKMRLSLASNAYIQGNIDEAIEFVEDAIRINAETHRAWTLLAELFIEKEWPRKSLTARIFAAKMRPKDIAGWLQCAALAVSLSEQLPEEAEEITNDAIHCYGAVLRANIEHREAREARGALYLVAGHPKMAARDYAFLVERDLSDIDSLRSLTEISLDLAMCRKNGKVDKPSAVIALYHRVIAHLQEEGPAPNRLPFDMDDVHALVTLLCFTRQFEEALHTLKSLSRWVLQRESETYWNSWTGDDREWDEDNTRRAAVAEFDGFRYSDSQYGHGLPLKLRTKLAVIRLKLGDEDEATVS